MRPRLNYSGHLQGFSPCCSPTPISSIIYSNEVGSILCIRAAQACLLPAMLAAWPPWPQLGSPVLNQVMTSSFLFSQLPFLTLPSVDVLNRAQPCHNHVHKLSVASNQVKPNLFIAQHLGLLEWVSNLLPDLFSTVPFHLVQALVEVNHWLFLNTSSKTSKSFGPSAWDLLINPTNFCLNYVSLSISHTEQLNSKDNSFVSLCPVSSATMASPFFWRPTAWQTDKAFLFPAPHQRLEHLSSASWQNLDRILLYSCTSPITSHSAFIQHGLRNIWSIKYTSSK